MVYLLNQHMAIIVLKYSPTQALQAGRPAPPTAMPSDLSPRRIVLKMLAVSSSHSKMQVSLSTEKAVSLLTGCVCDPSQDNVVNALITLANIAQNVRSHDMVSESVCRSVWSGHMT